MTYHTSNQILCTNKAMYLCFVPQATAADQGDLINNYRPILIAVRDLSLAWQIDVILHDFAFGIFLSIGILPTQL